jgi:hypothetical protein
MQKDACWVCETQLEPAAGVALKFPTSVFPSLYDIGYPYHVSWCVLDATNVFPNFYLLRVQQDHLNGSKEKDDLSVIVYTGPKYYDQSGINMQMSY